MHCCIDGAGTPPAANVIKTFTAVHYHESCPNIKSLTLRVNGSFTLAKFVKLHRLQQRNAIVLALATLGDVTQI